MTERQRQFVDEYLIDFNATRAYMAVYKNVKSSVTARANGSRVLAYDSVKAYLAERLEEIRSEKTADAREVMEYLTSVMRGESESEEIVVEAQGDYTSKARRMTKHPSEKDRLKAAELLGKRYGLYTDRVDLESDDLNLNIHIDYGDGA